MAKLGHASGTINTFDEINPCFHQLIAAMIIHFRQSLFEGYIELQILMSMQLLEKGQSLIMTGMEPMRTLENGFLSLEVFY